MKLTCPLCGGSGKYPEAGECIACKGSGEIDKKVAQAVEEVRVMVIRWAIFRVIRNFGTPINIGASADGPPTGKK